MRFTVLATILLFSTACGTAPANSQGQASHRATAVFAGGCFWCTESDFDKMPGVLDTTSGFTGGRVPNATYEQVSAGGTGHYEAVRVTYDPTRISYAQLVRRFLPTVDVTDGGGQFCDRGDSYRPAIFVRTVQEKRAAQAALTEAAKRVKQPIALKILSAGPFWPAEEYHQNYHTKNPIRYKFYRWNCGRDQRLSQVWQK